MSSGSPAILKSRHDADEWLSHSIRQAGLRQFLLQNLQLKEGQYQRRLNLDALSRAMPLITAFPGTSYLAPYSKKVLFVGGGLSGYLTKENQNLTRQLFLQASFSMIKSADHWLHAESPEMFLALIELYLSH